MNQLFFQFDDPYFFVLLFLVPVVFLFSRRASGVIKIHFSSVKLFAGVPRSFREKFKFVVPLLRALVLTLFIAALARPQWGNKTTESLSEGIDILLAIDTSGSMKALDFHLERSEANRLDAVKRVVGDFVSKRSHDRIGMVIFGEEAYTQCPLTLDYDVLRTFLKWVRIGVVGDGTAVGNGLATAVKRLKNQPTKSKIIILLTDGRNNAGEIAPLTAAAIAKEFGIKVYTIGVGSKGPVPYPEQTPFGVRKVYAELDLDEDTLKEIAQITGGQYFRATDTGELEEIYGTIDQLEKTEVKVKEYSEYFELYPWFLAAGLLFLVMEVLLAQTLFVRIP
ncbi:MAG: VWA domain-containing protein [Deltaproteobacteria bacterium]|nr:VWA domain-containing protein [Deltaproteobacteria bacterium]